MRNFISRSKALGMFRYLCTENGDEKNKSNSVCSCHLVGCCSRKLDVQNGNTSSRKIPGEPSYKNKSSKCVKCESLDISFLWDKRINPILRSMSYLQLHRK